MRVLVTGGAGYVGSHACKALRAAGHEPVAYDNLVYGHREAARWGPLETGDIADRARVDVVLEKYRPDALMHFAAYAYVGESVRDPGKYYRNNVSGSLTLLEAMRDHDIRFIVFSSSCATYGVPARVPIDEDAPQLPINPYGASKQMIERMLADFAAAHGIRYSCLRYFNAAGADSDGEIGELHDPETHLIPLVLQAALGQRPKVAIYGNDYPTPDGTCIRDFVHVSDLADAHVAALSYLTKGGNSVALNLGSGRGHSVREVIDVAKIIIGLDVPEVLAPRRPGDPPVLVADTARASQVLGWRAARSDLERVIADAWAWHQRTGHRT
jgi:UDP-arabinose 4-epimerase